MQPQLPTSSLRRSNPEAPATCTGVLAFGEFQLDLARDLLSGPHGPRALRPQAMAVLRLLIARAPALVTVGELLDQIWGRHAISPSAVPQAVRDLRRALGDDAERPSYVETRHRRGYRFLHDPRWIDHDGRRAVGDFPHCTAVQAVAGRLSYGHAAANDAGRDAKA